MKDELDKLTNKIEVLFTDLEATNYFPEKTQEYKSFYEYLNGKYQKILSDNVDASDFATINIMSQYISGLKDDILPNLKHLESLSKLIVNMKKIRENKTIEFDKISKLVNTFVYLYDRYNSDECEVVYKSLIDFLYKMIEREILELDTDNIINLLNDLNDGKCNFVFKIQSLYLKDVRVMSDIPLATPDNDKLDKQSFIKLFKARGLNYHSKKEKLIGFQSLFDVSNGKEMDCAEFRSRTKLNPLPKTEDGNRVLRSYNLMNIDYSIRDGLKAKLLFKPFKNVNLSHTSAIIIPKPHARKHPFSLENANLEGVDMRGVDLAGVNINGANLANTGADITNAIGTCMKVSPFIEPTKIFVTNLIISPEEFQKMTGHTAIPYNCQDVHSYHKHNRFLRLYNISCVDYSKIDFNLDNYYRWAANTDFPIESYTLDLSYTSANINPQDYKNYTSPILINLEGVDMRDKNFKGVERIFSMANLKGTGAKLNPSYNNTVSEYIEPAQEEV